MSDLFFLFHLLCLTILFFITATLSAHTQHGAGLVPLLFSSFSLHHSFFCLAAYPFISLSLSDEIHFLSSAHHYPSVMLSLHHLSLEPSFPQGLFSVHYHPHGIHSVANLHSACSYSLLILTLMQMHTHTYMLNSEL